MTSSMSTSPPARPIGPIVDLGPGQRPERTVHEGRFVRLEPLDADRHASQLWPKIRGADHIWDYMPDGPFADEAQFRVLIEAKAASPDPLFWAIVERASGEAVGYATLMRVDPTHRVIEVGNILYAPVLQQTPGATETMFLMARIVFDDLAYRRYEWKCNALNAPSRAAAARLGFSFEGIFRQHMMIKGRNRDTAWFSILDTEWPAVKQGFEAWLAAENFDAGGRQRQSLAALRARAHAAFDNAGARS